MRDEAAAERLRDLGWTVIRVGYDDATWAATVSRYASVFGARAATHS